MRRWLALIFGGLALLIAGYRIAQSTSVTGTTSTVTAPSPSTYAPPTTASSAAVPTTTPPTHSAPSYPVVAFTWTIRNPHAVWPFTAQLASITLNPNGFPGSGAEPPQDSYLMVQVNITSQITGRSVPPPDLQSMIVCHGPGDHGGSSWAEGYDAGESAPDLNGGEVAMGDGQPHPWDIEWVVPSSTPVTRVKCELGPDPKASSEGAPFVVKMVGKRRLN
jgi:hypothetical protein